MMIKKRLLLLTLILYCSFIEAAPTQVLLIRHAEKPLQGNSLSTKGRERAAALTPYFMETEALLKQGQIVAIYAMKTSKNEPSMRPIETVTPLATALQLTLNTNYEYDDYQRMVNEIMSEKSYHGRTVLICWEHHLIPEIARAFKALQSPTKWQDQIFDRVWSITISASNKASFQNIPQRLMFGDTSN